MKNSKRNLFIFGDSFSFGDGCRPEDEYYIKSEYKVKKIWPELLSDELNLKLNMYAGRGYSNQETLRLLNQNLYKIRKNDIVIIGLTDYYRFELFSNRGFYRFFYGSFKNIDDIDNLEFIKDDDTYEDEWCKAVEQYGKYIHYPYHLTYINNLYKSFTSIYEFLNTNEIKTILWTWEWSTKNSKIQHIPTKTEWTIQYEYPDIDDCHYSWYGHNQFYKEISKLINKVI